MVLAPVSSLVWLCRPSWLQVIIVPGYGMAVANAQYAVANLAKSLTAKGIQASTQGGRGAAGRKRMTRC
jgi:NAD/NADP transhydrogenase beta subunit